MYNSAFPEMGIFTPLITIDILDQNLEKNLIIIVLCIQSELPKSTLNNQKLYLYKKINKLSKSNEKNAQFISMARVNQCVHFANFAVDFQR